MRFFLLSGHYRNPINFSDALMEQAKNGLARMQNAKDNLKYLSEAGSDGAVTNSEKETISVLDKLREEFIEKMDDDLNTADAITAVFEMITAVNTQVKDGASKAFSEEALNRITELTDVLGLLQDSGADDSIDTEVQALIAERQKARAEKNFARADEIRDILKEKGITLKDTPQGVQIIKG